MKNINILKKIKRDISKISTYDEYTGESIETIEFKQYVLELINDYIET